MDFNLRNILALVGNLDDAPGDHSARERFRVFLKENVTEVGQVRDYIEECLRTSGDQYSRALQDLINHLGRFLGFDVTFGRYQGVQGQIGFDGHWKSATGQHLVVEVKTTEVYSIKTATLLNYINELVSQKAIADPDKALGLYVVGRPDPEIRQLENAILAERKTQQLRVISASWLISLAEMMNTYDIAHEDVLALVRPSTPSIDPVVELMSRLVAGSEDNSDAPAAISRTGVPADLAPAASPGAKTDSAGTVYWLTPVKAMKDETAEECIERLVGKERIFAFGDKTPGRKRIKPGDWICFYANGSGVVAHARVASTPEKKPNKVIRDATRFPWVFRLEEPVLYLNAPVVIDADLRSRLEDFQGRDPKKSWAWYVQGTGNITEHDFKILTASEGKAKKAKV
jgi:hypothetical protein